MDGAKKKKKRSHKSKHKGRSSPAAPTNGVERSSHHDEESPRPSKRKHESDHEHKKKRKKKKERHVAENDANGDHLTVPEPDQDQSAPSHSGGPVPQKAPEPKNPVQSTVDEAHATAPSSHAGSVGYVATGELNSKGQPKKQRGSRPGGKHNLKVGFFEPGEIEKLEKFKLDFCNNHGLSGQQFDTMVQHSERGGAEFPCPSDVTSKSEFWSDIYRTIPDRDTRSVYRFMRRHFQVTTQKPHEWTDEQDEELVQLHAEHGPKWVFIARLLGRSDDDVTQRWKNKLEHRHTMRRGPWSEDELRAFMEALQQAWQGYKQMLHEGAGNDVYEMDEKLVAWGAISNAMKNVRSRQQCADKWRKVRKAVLARRRDGFPDAVFDYTKAAKRSTRPTGKSGSAKSKEFVEEDDDGDDEGNVGVDSLPTSAATTPAPKLGFADQQHMMVSTANAAATSADSPSAPQGNVEAVDECETGVEGMRDEPDTPAAVNGRSSPVTPVTPLSATNDRRRDAGRMTRIKEKIKEANKSSSSKKRKRAEASSEPAQNGEVEKCDEQSSIANKQAEKERKKEKKRKKKEKKAQAKRKSLEIEAEAAKAVTPESEKKAKKHKKKRKSTDTAEIVEDIATRSPDEKRKTKHHKSSVSETSGATAEEPEEFEPPRKKTKEERQAVRDGTGGGGAEPQVHENPAPAPVADDDQAQSDVYSSDDDDSIKVEGSDSD